MTDTKHTPGPFDVYDDGGENFGIVRYADGNPVTTPDGCAMNGEVLITPPCIKNEADAHLFAAAPELLEALEEARHTIYEMANNGGCVNDDKQTHESIIGPLLVKRLEIVDTAIAKARGGAK